MNTDRAVKLFLVEYDYLGMAPKTIEHYRWSLGKLARAHKRLPTSREPVMRLINPGHLAPQSRVGLWRDYSRFWRWLALRHGLANVMLDVPRPRIRRLLPQVLQASDVERILAACRSRRDRAMISVFLDTGIRSGELAGLSWSNIGADGVRVDGKTGERVVPLSPHVRQLLVGLGGASDIWTGARGRLGNWGVQQAVRRILYRAGITESKAGPHVLRHTFATLFVKSGGNVRVLQQILGHTDLKTTMIYVHLAQGDIAADHAAHSPMANIRLVHPKSALEA